MIVDCRFAIGSPAATGYWLLATGYGRRNRTCESVLWANRTLFERGLATTGSGEPGEGGFSIYDLRFAIGRRRKLLYGSMLGANRQWAIVNRKSPVVRWVMNQKCCFVLL